MIHAHEIVVDLCVEYEGLDLGRENRNFFFYCKKVRCQGYHLIDPFMERHCTGAETGDRSCS